MGCCLDKEQEWMLRGTINGLRSIISICHHTHPRRFHFLFFTALVGWLVGWFGFWFLLRKAMDCLKSLASVWVQPMVGNYGTFIGQKTYSLASLPVRPSQNWWKLHSSAEHSSDCSAEGIPPPSSAVISLPSHLSHY